jgi:hypothetical protein
MLSDCDVRDSDTEICDEQTEAGDHTICKSMNKCHIR